MSNESLPTSIFNMKARPHQRCRNVAFQLQNMEKIRMMEAITTIIQNGVWASGTGVVFAQRINLYRKLKIGTSIGSRISVLDACSHGMLLW